MASEKLASIRVVRPDKTIDSDALQRALDEIDKRLGGGTSAPKGLSSPTVAAGSIDPRDRGVRAEVGTLLVSTKQDDVRVFQKTGASETAWSRLAVLPVTELGSGATGNDLTLTGSLTLQSQLTGSSAYFSGSLTVAGISTLTGDATVAGSLTGSAATFSQSVYVGGQLNADGQMNVSGSLVGIRSSHNLAASQNNWAVGSGVLFVRFTSSVGAINITGIAAGGDGQVLFLINADTVDTITLVNQSASSTDVNRFLTVSGANIALAPGEMAIAWYDISTQRWRVGTLGG